MRPVKGERLITFLKWPSLLLVAILLSLFLFKSYTSEKQRIEKEVGLLFVNAVKGLEGNFLNSLILDSLRPDVFFDNISHPGSVKWHARDTNKNAVGSRTMIFSTNKIIEKDSFKITLKKNIDFDQQHKIVNDDLTETKGVISIMMRTSNTDTGNNKTIFAYRATPDSGLTKKILTSFDDNLSKAGLNINYHFNQSHDTALAYIKNSPTGIYKDLASGQNYSVAIKHANLLALKSIWLEIALSFLLLACLALAFYSMSRTIAEERNLMQSKNDFIQNMTHELKTPISTVKLALEGLYEYDGLQDMDKRDEYLKISQQEVDRLAILVDRVLSISKLDKELPPAVKENILVNELVSQIIDTFRVQALKQNAIIQLHSNEIAITTLSDRQWLSGIVYNLLENALKYADKEHTQIDVYLSKLEGYIELKVRDNGPGIAEAHLSKIFEKFYRIPQGNIHTVKGHGLGLAFVKRLVQEMGGKITLLSDMGKGSEFSVTIPA